MKRQQFDTQVAIVGAGPYGLSLASHLRESAVPHRIFGRPMQSWQRNMPDGMCLKSDGYASTLYDPRRAFTLAHYCAEQGLAYKHSGMPIPLETFLGYGLEFQRRMVPQLEREDIEHVSRAGAGFTLRTAGGERFTAARVVLAVGITHFGYLPPQLAGLPAEAVTHSFAHRDLNGLAGKRVLVVGAGASAVDTAASLADAGAEVHIMGRRPKIGFYMPEMDPRPLRRRVLYPRSGLGVGWEYVVCVETPLLFRALPQRFRHRVVRRHLGPIPGWFMKDKVEGRIAMHMSAQIERAEWDGGRVRVFFDQPGQPGQVFEADHVIAATGYKPSIPALKFLDPELAVGIGTEGETPRLNRNFETTVAGLYMIGLASANCFGPAQRFAVGAKYTSKHLASHLRRSARGASLAAPTPVQEGQEQASEQLVSS